MSIKIAIQGIESYFHHLAVQKLFPNNNVTLMPCDSFDKVTANITNLSADFGVIAIENSIAGSILPNYTLIDRENLQILDEVFLNIDMYLMALEGETLHTIDEIHSHPVALQQCKDYLMRVQPHCKIVEGKDTASEAKRIKEGNLKGVAAIAGKQVAEKYGLKILDSHVQSLKEDKTRFVVLGRNTEASPIEANKASLKFILGHEVGNLSNVLQLLNTFNINLTKIQSLPIPEKPWEYAFFVDVLFEDKELFSEVITMLGKTVKELKVLGVYRQNFENTPSHLIENLVHGK
ncbi:prephenate dehydratase [Aequorivita sublithincola DSM 14238]|uniref:prephenate dehydratase n=1 Tax=Aequorivita sublithincola (strain DSM 14238 / LMG 21431 / ACAM 643 / 9-3) TaxID=746697 RepID=I3YWF6_AEQSU|nr:prephenate dehydratase domain-containing protein [Aequorivita sublithincola]AFL81324.1 prephenate dehydratase [Aequorivita sublithincola DSM 14238]